MPSPVVAHYARSRTKASFGVPPKVRRRTGEGLLRALLLFFIFFKYITSLDTSIQILPADHAGVRTCAAPYPDRRLDGDPNHM